MLTSPHLKNWSCCGKATIASGLDCSFGTTEQRTRVMRFCTWNVRSLCRSGSVTTVARELARYKLDLVGVQEVRWDTGEM